MYERQLVYVAGGQTDDIELAVSASLHKGFEDRRNPITAISTLCGYTLISLQQTSTHQARWNVTLLRLLKQIAAEHISIELLQTHATSVRFLAPSGRLDPIKTIATSLGLTFHGKARCAKVSIIGAGVRTTAGVLHRGLATLIEAGISVPHWADSNVTLAFVVDDEQAAASEEALRAAFAPDHRTGEASLSFDADLALVRVHGSEVKLGARQAQLLRYFLDNVGRIIPIEELSKYLFRRDDVRHHATVRVHLHNLRKKIETNTGAAQHLVTVPEQGYVFVR